MKKIAWLLTLGVLPLLIAGCAAQAVKTEETVTQISAESLVSAYAQSNELRAEHAYTNALVLVTGIVTNVGKNSIGAYVVLSDSANPRIFQHQVQCFIKKGADKGLEDLNAGQILSIEGRCTGDNLFNIEVHDCVIK